MKNSILLFAVVFSVLGTSCMSSRSYVKETINIIVVDSMVVENASLDGTYHMVYDTLIVSKTNTGVMLNNKKDARGYNIVKNEKTVYSVKRK